MIRCVWVSEENDEWSSKENKRLSFPLEYYNLSITKDDYERTKEGQQFTCMLVDFYLTFLQKDYPKTKGLFSDKASEFFIFKCAFYRTLYMNLHPSKKMVTYDFTSKGETMRRQMCKPLKGAATKGMLKVPDHSPKKEFEFVATGSQGTGAMEIESEFNLLFKPEEHEKSEEAKLWKKTHSSSNDTDKYESMEKHIEQESEFVDKYEAIQKHIAKESDFAEKTPKNKSWEEYADMEEEMLANMKYHAAKNPRSDSSGNMTSLFSKKYILIPVNIKNYHWILVMIRNLNNFMKIFEKPTKKKSTKPNCDDPAILVFDSLGMCSHQNVLDDIRCYLNFRFRYEKSEFFPKDNDAIPKVFTEETLPGFSCDVPQQTGVDCGVFVVTYAQKFLEFPIDDIPIFKHRWFQPYQFAKEIPAKRKEIREILNNLPQPDPTDESKERYFRSFP